MSTPRATTARMSPPTAIAIAAWLDKNAPQLLPWQRKIIHTAFAHPRAHFAFARRYGMAAIRRTVNARLEEHSD